MDTFLKRLKLVVAPLAVSVGCSGAENLQLNEPIGPEGGSLLDQGTRADTSNDSSSDTALQIDGSQPDATIVEDAQPDASNPDATAEDAGKDGSKRDGALFDAHHFGDAKINFDGAPGK